MARDFRRVPCSRWSVISVLVAVVLLPAGLAEGRRGGIASSSFDVVADGCHNCHILNPGTAPMVSLGADDTSLSAGQQITLTFAVTSQAAAQTHAGFNIRSSQQGTFAIGGPAFDMTRTIVGAMGWLEATHSARKPNVGITATFTVLWTPAPATSGVVTFTAWGNSVNNDDTNAGDRAAMTMLDVTVASGCVPVPETCNGLDDDCDGIADNGLPTSPFFLDTDGDGFGAAASMKQACSLAQAGAGYVANGMDCDDGNGAIKPGVAEICNGKDDNCNGSTDEGLPPLTCGVGSCATTVPACVAGVPQTCIPICPPEPDAAVDAASESTPIQDQDAALPVDVASDPTELDQSLSVDVPSVDVRSDEEDAVPAADAAGDVIAPPPIVDVTDAAPSPDLLDDVATRPPAGDRAADASSLGMTPGTDHGCSCRVGAARRGSSAVPLLLATLLLAILARATRRKSRASY